MNLTQSTNGVMIIINNVNIIINISKVLIFFNYFVIDVDDVKYVINFDYPSSSEDYIHRIGRTGRRRQTGTAYAFFTSHNMKHAGDLIEVLREAGQNINPRLTEMAELAKSGTYGSRSMFLKYFHVIFK